MMDKSKTPRHKVR
jgi:hypothetical protein